MSDILSTISRFTAETFVAGLWQGLALIAAVALALRPFSRLPASIRFAVWSLTFALVVAMPLFHLRRGAAPIGSPHTPAAVFHIANHWAIAITVIWSLLTLARLTQFVAQAIRLRRIWKRATPVIAPDPVRKIMEDTRRNVELSTSADVDTPCVIGFLSPRLLIPQSLFHSLSDSDLRQVVLHECEHLRRRDDWINLAQKLALALFPLNPALLFADRRLCLERELACDAGVVARTDAPFDYAHCLTRLAEHRLHSRRLSLALSAWSRQSELGRRVHSLLSPIDRLSPVYARASVAAFTVALTIGAVELARAPHLVSFTNPVTAPIATGADTVYRPAVAPQAVPVLYQPVTAGQPHPTLLKATAPLARPTANSAPQGDWRGGKQVHRAATIKHPQPKLIRASRTQPASTLQSDEVRALYVTTEFSPSYAAVPFGDGWLIIQL